MDYSEEVKILAPLTQNDKEWLKGLWVSEWGSEIMISKGQTYHLQDMNSVIAWVDGVRVGAATYRLGSDECELMSINSTVSGSGIGSKLILTVEQIVKQTGINRLWLLTTNDNVDALRFYQRRGYRITSLHPNAVDLARQLKPTIPLVGYYDIPIHDEIVLEKTL